MRPTRAFVLAVLCPFAVFAQPARALPDRVDLAVGAEVVLTLPALLRLSVGDSAIADVRPGDDMTLTVIGVAGGETTISVWLTPDGKPVVIPVRVAGPAKAARADPHVALRVGHQKLLTPGGKVLRAAIGDSAIAEVKHVGNDLLLVTGGAPGETPLTLWLEGGTQKSFRVVVAQ